MSLILAWRAKRARGSLGASPTDHPFARILVQRFATVFGHEQRLAKLQAHFFVVGHQIGLDDDDHIFTEGQVARLVALAGFGLKDRRVLADAMDQVVVGAITALVDDFGGFFGFG